MHTNPQVYAPAIKSAMAAGKSAEEARSLAQMHLLRKTTMFSPRLLLDAGGLRSLLVSSVSAYWSSLCGSAFKLNECVHPVDGSIS